MFATLFSTGCLSSPVYSLSSISWTDRNQIKVGDRVVVCAEPRWSELCIGESKLRRQHAAPPPAPSGPAMRRGVPMTPNILACLAFCLLSETGGCESKGGGGGGVGSMAWLCRRVESSGGGWKRGGVFIAGPCSRFAFSRPDPSGSWESCARQWSESSCGRRRCLSTKGGKQTSVAGLD